MVDFSNFRSWVESQPPEQKYMYQDSSNCAIGQFMKSQHPGVRVGVGTTDVCVGDVFVDLPAGLDDAVSARAPGSDRYRYSSGGALMGSNEDTSGQTFGQLAERLKSLEVA